jgi:hypothetical protein
LRFSVFVLRLRAFVAPGNSPRLTRAELNLVNITAVVRSPDGKLLRNLNKEDFGVFEYGVPQTIQLFARESETAQP